VEVNPLYQQTEAGTIPKDWQIASLQSLTTLVTNGFVGTVTKHYAPTEDGILYIQGYNVEENSLNFHGIKYVTNAFHKVHLKSCLRAGDLLTIQTGDVGLTTIVPASLAGANCHALIISRFDQKRSCAKYISYYLNSGPGRARMRLIETGTTMKHLNVGDMLQFTVPLPPKTEQEAIAEALTDADALIESMEQLLAKKRHLKQGAMQELLTGKKRLPGFSGDLKLRQLGDVADTDPDNLGSDTRRDYAFNYIALEDVDVGTLNSHSEWMFATAPSRARRKLRKYDILVSTVRPNLQSHLLMLFTDENWICSTGFCVVRCKAGISHPGFVYFQMFGGLISRQIEALLTGSNYPAINSGDVRALRIPLPEYEEQSAIAAILSDMDNEITALQTKLTKTRHLKQAMMQELLTGRIRLL